MLFLSWNVVSAQWVEDFSDGNFSNQPAWTGDTAQFVVSSSGQLETAAPDAGTACLFTPVAMASLNSMEWRFTIRLDFAPSSSNFCRVYLAMDQPGVAGNGYFLQFGEALSNDAVELFRQDGPDVVSICRATDGAISAAFEIGVKVIRDRDAVWSLFIDYQGGDRYQLEGVGAEALYSQANWFGLQCTHTVSNGSGFHFDDFYIGPETVDTVSEVIAMPGEVVFNEILFEPHAASMLPDDEFIELFHAGSEPFEIDGWSLSDGSTTAVFPAHTAIFPGSYLIVCAVNDTDDLDPYGKTIGLTSFPSLNNDIGDRLLLRDRAGNIIDAVTFSDATYSDRTKQDGGWTIERIDPYFRCQDAGNWRASEDPAGGTPGEENSVYGSFTDDTPPTLDYGYVSGNRTMTLFFSEPVDTTATAATDAVIVIQPTEAPPVVSATWKSQQEVELRFDSLSARTIYRLRADSYLRDCPGNVADTSFTIHVGTMRPPVPGDLLINELLFDAGPGNEDFVEIINRSEDIIDLQGIRIAETTRDGVQTVDGPDELIPAHRPIFPKEVAAFCTDPVYLPERYRSAAASRIFETEDLPDFNIEEGGVDLLSAGDTLLDHFPYASSMHHPLLLSVQGVSLERVTLEGPSSLKSVWHSAAEDAGFATPGRWNSQAVPETGGAAEVAVDPLIISPDNDGKDDLLVIAYRFPDSGRVGSVRIYSESGYLVRKLVDEDLLSTEGRIMWDGLDEEGSTVMQGRYVVVAMTFDRNGSEKQYRVACGVVYE